MAERQLHTVYLECGLSLSGSGGRDADQPMRIESVKGYNKMTIKCSHVPSYPKAFVACCTIHCDDERAGLHEVCVRGTYLQRSNKFIKSL